MGTSQWRNSWKRIRRRKIYTIKWKTESRIEESKVKIKYGKRARIQSEDDIVLDDAPNSIICLDVDIQQENL